ncbi:MAG: ATP-binding protein [Planctomycetes bacterium]|nr:ATP-binding protein [Planctomycetota bacterium]
MKRRAAQDLSRWLESSDRRPLVVRGARQVGKTWLARDLAEREGLDLVELNFERDPALARLFESNDPASILGEIELQRGRSVSPATCLLFLDEIQAAGELLAKLRWFYESLPELAVVAAGSLLEFTLSDHSFSMPVGRITFRRVEPISFAEFLEAHDNTPLLDRLEAWRVGSELSATAHDQALARFDHYSMVGGMPATVAADIGGASPQEVRALQNDLLATYRADFAKYSGRMDRQILDLVLTSVARSLGNKFVYARAGDGVKGHQVKRGLELLEAAQLVTLVRYSAANGVPLGAESKDTSRKAALLDVALLHPLIGTPAGAKFPSWDALVPDSKARISEQLAVQQLRLLGDAHRPAELYFWRREGGRAGEVDHVVQVHGRVVPLKLKAGTAGSMKSLHQFMFDKGLDLAVRVDRNPPSLSRLDVKTTQGDRVVYDLLNLPLYLLWNLETILAGLHSE